MSVPLRSAFVFVFGASCLAIYWASCPPPSAPPQVMTRERFEKLIDSLANRNPKPILVSAFTNNATSQNILLAADYDFDGEEKGGREVGSLCSVPRQYERLPTSRPLLFAVANRECDSSTCQDQPRTGPPETRSPRS